MKYFIKFLVLIAMSRDMLFGLLMFILNLLEYIKLKSECKSDVNKEKLKCIKLQKLSFMLLAFCSAIGIIRNINMFIGILSSFDMPAIIIQLSLSVAGLALFVLSLNDSKVKEIKKLLK